MHQATSNVSFNMLQAVELAVAKGEMVALNKRLEALQATLNSSKAETDAIRTKLEAEVKDHRFVVCLRVP